MTSSRNNKTVSVILPNYNYAKYISGRIDEVLNQTYPVSEIIILDDASTDNSVEIIKEKCVELKKLHPEITIRVLVNKQNSSNVFSQWQKGIKLATSDYIWIAELDDVAKPQLLEVALEHSDDNTALVCAGSRFIDENGKLVLKDNLRKIKDSFRRNILVYNTIPNVSAVVFKNNPKLCEFLEEAKKYHLSGDWYFYVRISELGKIVYLKRVLNYHRLHEASVTGATDCKKRLAEMKSIHKYILEKKIPNEMTKKSMERIEVKLKKKWNL